MARLLPTLLVLALLGCTAAAFAVTENLKLEKSPITKTKVDKVIAPDSEGSGDASIGFVLRKRDRITVSILNGNGDVIRTLVNSRPARAGSQSFLWDGRDEEGHIVADGMYRPRVHLARERRTIVLPNPIRMDATPPLIRLASLGPREFSPDRDFRREYVRIRYQTNEKARAILYVNADRRTMVRAYVRAGKLDWGGRAARGLPEGLYRIRLRALDLAGNLGPPSRAVTVRIRYIGLRPLFVSVRIGKRFGFRVLTDAKRYSVHFANVHEVRRGNVLVLRAPQQPGRYLLRVAANGHTARARVVVGP